MADPSLPDPDLDTFAGSGAAYGPVVDQSAVPAALKNAAKGVLKKPRDATFLKTRGGKVFGVAAAGNGRSLDVDKTVARIVAALEARAAGTPEAAPVKVATTKVAPEVSTEEATAKAPLVSRIGTWTTYYQAGPRNGNSANIVIPARRLSGQVSAPARPSSSGGPWARSASGPATGWAPRSSVAGPSRTARWPAASRRVDHAVQRRRARRPGVLSRRPHYYYISRYPLGLDATVSDAITMRFRNDPSTRSSSRPPPRAASSGSTCGASPTVGRWPGPSRRSATGCPAGLRPS